MKPIDKKSTLSYWVILLVPILGLAIGVGLSSALRVNGQPHENLVVNTVFLLAVLLLIPLFRFSAADMGLKVNRKTLGFHVLITLAIFISYLLFDIFVIRISSLKPITPAIVWDLIAYVLVVFAEEIYIRGQVYTFIEKRHSATTALIVSAILFGVLHARQGIAGIITKSITGALWGSVRYTTDMIHMLIFPVHFAYNATWLLFEGNWNALPVWANYAPPLGEITLMFLILYFHRIRYNQRKNV